MYTCKEEPCLVRCMLCTGDYFDTAYTLHETNKLIKEELEIKVELFTYLLL